MAIKIGSNDIEALPGISKVYVGDSMVWPTEELYLEIQPKILWMVDWAQNDVFSNTSWGIN